MARCRLIRTQVGCSTTMATNLARVLEQKQLPDNNQWTNRFEVRSETSNRVYIIAQNKSGRWWGCSCPGWIRYKRCKHLTQLALPGNFRPLEIVRGS